MNARSTRQVVYRLLPGIRREIPDPIILVVPPPPVQLDLETLVVLPSTPPPVISPITSTLLEGFMTGFGEHTSLVDLGWNGDRPIVETVRSGIDTTDALNLRDSASFISRGHEVSGGKIIHVRVYFALSIDTFLAGVQQYGLCGLAGFGGGENHTTYIEVNTFSGEHRLVVRTQFFQFGTYHIQENIWYRLEMKCTPGGSGFGPGSTTARLYLGDTMTLVEEVTKTDAAPSSTGVVTLGHTISAGGQDVHYLLDDLIVANTPDWIGPGTTHTRPPTSPAALQWSPDGAATNLLAILGIPGGLTPASFVKTPTAGHKDSYLVSLADIDPYKRLGYSNIMSRTLMSGGNNGSLRGYEKDNAGMVWNGVTVGVTFQNFLRSLGLRQWNLPSVAQFATWEVGYECLNPAGIDMRIPDFWYQVDVRPAP